MLLSRAAPLACLLAAAAITPASAQIGPRVTADARPISPSVVAIYIGEHVEPGMERLRLLVLWRDEPGWFAAGPQTGGGGGSSTGEYRMRWRTGNVELEAALDSRTQTAIVLGQAFDLRHSNVILVDGAASNGAVVGTLGVQAQLLVSPGVLSMEAVAPVFTLPEIRQFLRCDQPASVRLSIPVQMCSPPARGAGR